MSKNNGTPQANNHHRDLDEDYKRKTQEHSPAAEDSNDMAHMGASEDQAVAERPMTEALDKLLKDDKKGDTQSSNDELTPG